MTASKDRISKAFFNTVDRWPVLAGFCTPVSGEPDKLDLVYGASGAVRDGRPDLLQFKQLGGDIKAEQYESSRPLRWDTHDEVLAQVEASHEESIAMLRDLFGKHYFISKEDPEPGQPFSPVTLKATFVGHSALVLGFAFNEVMFDSESIRSFIGLFQTNT